MIRNGAKIAFAMLAAMALPACGGADVEERPAATVGGVEGDKQLCTEANTVGEAWKDAWIEIHKAAVARDKEPTAAELQEALENYATALTSAARGNSGRAAELVRVMAASTAKAATAKEPNKAFAADTDFDKAIDELVVVCASAGVTIPH